MHQRSANNVKDPFPVWWSRIPLAATVTLGYIDAARLLVFESEIRWHVN